MSTPPLTGPDLTAARHLIHHYGLGGHTGGSFATLLIRALDQADLENRERLLTAYPEYRRAVYILNTAGAEALADTVAISDRLRWAGAAEDAPYGPRTAAAIHVASHGGKQPTAIEALRDVAQKIEEAQRAGFSPVEFVTAYLVQLTNLSDQESR